MDSEKFEELKKLTAFARKNGLEEVKIDGIEIKLNASALFPESSYKQKKAAESGDDQPKVENTLTEDELLFWSSGQEFN